MKNQIMKQFELPESDLKAVFSELEYHWSELRNQRILLSGGTGFVGIWLVETFLYASKALGLNSELHIVSRNPEKFLTSYPHLRNYPELRFIKGDVRNVQVPKLEFQFVIHAALSVASMSNKTDFLETLDVGFNGTKGLLEQILPTKNQKILLVSSGAVYKELPFDVLGSAYGQAKKNSEWLCSYFSEVNKFNLKIARCFAFVGPHLPLDSHFAIGNFIRQGLKGETIEVKGDGQSVRSYMYASDLTAWLWKILFIGSHRVAYDVGSDKAVSILEVAQSVARLCGSNSKVVIHGQSSLSLSEDRYLPVNQLAKNELNMNVKVSLDESIQKTLDFYRQQRGLQ